ncbi:MAG: GHKL domain-containing protein [Desulfobacterales bacterium]|nr:GHKL domain-containing protein [Desulfobacterales bacterium]
MTSSSLAKKLVPIVSFLLFGGIALTLWQDQNRHGRELAFRHTETAAEQIRIRVEGLMNARIASLQVFAERWVERRPPDFSQKRFLQFAEKFYGHYPGFMGINWIDPQGVVRWVYPEVTNAIARGKSAYKHPDPKYRAAFENAEQSLERTATPCVELYQWGTGFDSFWPLLYDGKVQGYLNGVFQVKLIMDLCLAKEIFKDFWVRIYEEGRLIYHHGTRDDLNFKRNRLHAVRKIHFRGKAWQLELEPKPTVYSPAHVRNLWLLAFGIFVAVTLSLLLRLLLGRMEMYRAARDQALHEVGERKRAEQALLEKEKTLEALLAELSAKNEELETFVYTVSHDLKTPIVTIDGFIGAFKEEIGQSLSEDSKQYLKYMSDASRKMGLLIDDLLDLSRVGRVSEKKRKIPFAEVVEDALKTLQPQIEARAIVVSIREDLPVVYVERKRLGQVMENLLGNAIKYIGKDNPSPCIEVGAEEKNGQKVFYIRDNGIGIEEMYFDKIFQIFQRLPSAKKLGEGTGIGLTIVRRIIEHHGGKVWLTSEPGKGTTFFFSLKEKEA